MDTDLKDLTSTVQNQLLDGLGAVQQSMLEGITSYAELLDTIVPDSVKSASLPGMDQLPSAREAVVSGFEFAERVLASQRAFAERLVAIPSSETSASAGPAAKGSTRK